MLSHLKVHHVGIACVSIEESKVFYEQIKEYEDYLKSDRKFRPMAMQCLAAGALKPDEAIEYVTRFPKIESVLFGASSKVHIQQTKDVIEQGFARYFNV